MHDARRPSRRTVLAGSAAALAAIALGSCADDASIATPPTSGNQLYLANRVPPNGFAVPGAEQRFPLSVLDGRGQPPAQPPQQLRFTVRSGGDEAGAPIDAALRTDGIPLAYYAVRFTPEAAGTYEIVTSIDGIEASTPIQVAESVVLPQRGAAMPGLVTPTQSDAMGVRPLCTQRPEPCPLHDLSLDAALGSGAPTAFLVSTPAYCQIGVCGPVLDLVLEQRQRRPDVQFIHCEVYRDPEATEGNLAGAELVPTVTELGLDFEPCLFVVAADGTVVDRLDTMFDRSELTAAFDRLPAG